MSKKKNNPEIESISSIVDEPTLEQTENLGEQPNNTNAELESEFAKMESTNSEMSPDNVEEQLDTEKPNESLKDFELAKVRMFLGFACFFMAGFHTLILNKLRHASVPASALALGTDEQDALMIYLNNRQVLELIDKIPVAVIGFIHFEYMMITKFNAVYPQYKKEDIEK